MEKILVPTDGSKNSKKALKEAKKYAQAFNAELVLLNVVQIVVLGTYMSPHYNVSRNDTTFKTNEELYRIGEETLEECMKLFDDFKDNVKAKLKTGEPADEIINEVEEENYDLVIMGSRGLGSIKRTMIGSVSNKVLNHIETDILIIK